MPDYGSSGIWVNEPAGPFRHSMIAHDTLGLDKALSERFEAWIRQYWLVLDAPEQLDVQGFNEEGRELAKELKRQAGGSTEIRYVPLTDDGGLAEDEIITV